MKAPPQVVEAERAVLGSALLRGAPAMRDVMDVVVREDFYDPRHALIFGAMVELQGRGEAIDSVTVELQLRSRGELKPAGGLPMLVWLADHHGASRNVVHHAELVRRFAALRRIVAAAGTIIETAETEGAEEFETYLARAEDSIRAATAQAGTREGYTSAKQHVLETFGAIRDAALRGNPMTGVPTGFYDFDRMTCGLQPGDLVVVAARPSMGKTAWALAVTEEAALRARIPVLWFSLEMGARQLTTRLLCAGARVDAQRVRRGELMQDDWARLVPVGEALSQAPISIDEQPSPTILDIAARSRRWRADRKIFPQPGALGLIVIDYLQLVRGGRRRYDLREQEVSEVSRTAKAIAKELQVPVLALSQLNRAVDGRADHRPQLSDLRESGAIEQDADVVAFLYREERYETDPAKRAAIINKAELDIGKQRNGPIGTVLLHFEHSETRFSNAARGDRA